MPARVAVWTGVSLSVTLTSNVEVDGVHDATGVPLMIPLVAKVKGSEPPVMSQLKAGSPPWAWTCSE